MSYYESRKLEHRSYRDSISFVYIADDSGQVVPFAALFLPA